MTKEERALALLKRYEKWEAELTLDEKSFLLDNLSDELYNELIDMQTERNEILNELVR